MLAGIIPANRLENAKTRLTLPPSGLKKSDLVKLMLENVISAANESNLDQVYVVSGDDILLGLSRSMGVETITEPGSVGVNGAVALGNSRAISDGARATMVIFSDLPLVQKADIDGIIEIGRSDRGCVVASPSSRGGTNVLWRDPPDIIPTRYGENSFIVHREEAAGAGVPFHSFHSDGTCLDVDMLEDFELLLKRPCFKGKRSIVRFMKEEYWTEGKYGKI
jgi:2-phospho-L-lactate guanylyltransferase